MLFDSKGFYAWALIVQIIGLVFIAPEAGSASINTIFLWSGLAWGCIGLIRGGLSEVRYRSPQFVCPDFSDSISGPEDFKKKGDFLVVHLGGWRAFGIHKTGNKSTVLIHKDYYDQLGNNLVSRCQMEMLKHMNHLPPNLREAEESGEIEFSKPVYVGFVAPDDYGKKLNEDINVPNSIGIEELSDPSVDQLVTYVKILHEWVNDQREMLKRRRKEMEQEKNYVNNMSGPEGPDGGGLGQSIKTLGKKANPLSGGGSDE